MGAARGIGRNREWGCRRGWANEGNVIVTVGKGKEKTTVKGGPVGKGEGKGTG